MKNQTSRAEKLPPLLFFFLGINSQFLQSQNRNLTHVSDFSLISDGGRFAYVRKTNVNATFLSHL